MFIGKNKPNLFSMPLLSACVSAFHGPISLFAVEPISIISKLLRDCIGDAEENLDLW